MTQILKYPTQYWVCPSCEQTHVTFETKPHLPMHSCPKLYSISAPFVNVNDPQRARHVVVEREDYVGSENVGLNAEGRPIMSVRTERADGSNDTHVFAPAVATNR